MDVSPGGWILVALGALLIGFGKGGLPGAGNPAIVIYASVFGAKPSVGILLVVLICADMVATTIYRRHAAWKYIVKLFPWTALGVLLGALFTGLVSDAQMQVIIGSILLLMTGLHFWRKHRQKRLAEGELEQYPHRWWFAGGTGILGGIATMMANAAGPVAAMYLLSVGLPKYAFIGTSAWFFFLINLFKVPFQVHLGTITWETVHVSCLLGLFAALGAVIAPSIVRHINQRVFEMLVWTTVVIASILLIV